MVGRAGKGVGRAMNRVEACGDESRYAAEKMMAMGYRQERNECPREKGI
jgi:hypothetical protein